MTSVRSPRVGLVGCGQVAQYGHLPAILAEPALELAAVCDVSHERLAGADVPEDVARVTSLDQMPDLDALVVTSPAGVHADHVAWAARHRLTVLCEKPLALDEATSIAMVEQMQTAGAPLVGRFHLPLLTGGPADPRAGRVRKRSERCGCCGWCSSGTSTPSSTGRLAPG